MDSRDNGDSVLFCHAESNGRHGCPSNSFPYHLVPVDELYRHFDYFDWSSEQYKQAFETKVHPFKKFFGKSNGDSEKLVLPPATVADQERAIDNFSSPKEESCLE